MHYDAFDRYHETESFIHRLDPRVKVVVTIAFILSNALLPDGVWPPLSRLLRLKRTP